MIGAIITWCWNHSKATIAAAVLLGLWGGYCFMNIKIDAIPDLSETQVIIYSEWMGRSPDLVEAQITYPLVSTLLSAPKVKVARGFSMFGMSFVYVIFEDGTDNYWARARVLEYLSKISGQLPEGVTPSMGPDASGVGWVLQYALVDPEKKYNLAQIKTFQDWYLKYWLSAVPGVAEVASVGGFDKQYQVEVDPNKLSALNIPLEAVISAIRNSNNDVGGRTLEISEREYYIRGLGYVKNPRDLENIALGINADATPVLLRDVARVTLGPDIRRGISDLNGQGDTVGGVIVMRQGEDVSRVIAAVKEKITAVKGAFPPGLELELVYDRSDLISEAVQTLQENLLEEIILVCIVILFFLFHIRSVLVVVITLPLSLLISLIPMYYFDISLNIMSLGGIILAVGDIVDGVVVFIENTHTKIANSDGKKTRQELALEACRELGPAIFSALLIISISFLPIFALQAQEGKLFHPLAYTKTFAMLAAALVTITLVPILIALFVKGRIRKASDNPLNRWLLAIYTPVVSWAVAHIKTVFASTALLIAVSAALFLRLGSEFMPPLWEGDLLYMPITVPGISVTAAQDILTRQNLAIKAIPEVLSSFGKAGRFETATDPAPLSMFEYTIRLKPQAEWRQGLTPEALIQELDAAVAVPGLNRAWTKPVRGRIDMLSTGIRTPVGIKIFGQDLATIEHIGQQIEQVLSTLPGTRSAYAERINEGYYLDFEADKAALARYGLLLGDVQMIIETAIGGMDIAETVEGRERYSINLRYPRELRDSVEKIERILVATPTGTQVPLGQLGKVITRTGPPMVLDENGSLAGYVYIDLLGRDAGGYVNDAKAAIASTVHIPPGYFITWTGQYEYLARMQERMAIVLPVTLLLVFAFLYFSMRSTSRALIVMVAVPLSLSGGIILMWFLNYNISVAVWAGAIALIGVAVSTTSIMMVFLDQSWQRWQADGRLLTANDGQLAVVEGAKNSLRSVLMAVAMNVFGLMPVMLATGIGADVMKTLASPMFGGLLSLTVLTLLVVPCVYRQIYGRHLPGAASTEKPAPVLTP
ncbi:efflux RND transporter permease subunit [Cellvibrio sp. QJXJ]|uniref:efflux RND transporter permease subunit n=1 Tax=Cellvibrio sp. QJXJ TaxID=2964606 RepID=UPI0021C48BCC|nr:CusA/CzcA family heavy metal efflux RND transporter [Cellvibrio sp. QJXJ]UUA74992.1 CusA/CzcA family heavy metal efflux RND transporter [Cellvibrio sp. QJXJ]